MIVIGIDIGGSTTKIIGVNESDGKTLEPMQVKANDPITSVYGAFGRYISEHNIDLSTISKIKVTGVGSTYIKDDIYRIETLHVNEFTAIGLGGLKMSELSKAIIVSMGTGTSFVHADGTQIYRMGGTGVGGGTLLGLSSLMLDISNFDSIVDIAKDGNLGNIDLSVGEMATVNSYMSSNVTASNFGKVSDYANKSDIALGLINMVFQTVGMMSVFASRIDDTKDVVLCGSLTTVPNTNEFFSIIEDLHDIKFHLPRHAEYATALGAALSE